jgi:acylphosphatase
MMMKAENRRRLHALVYGRVQGVGFRYFVMSAAAELGLVGWTRNRREGYVEVVAEGEMDDLDTLVQTLNRGSNSSSVREVKADLQEPSGEFNSFFVRPTL